MAKDWRQQEMLFKGQGAWHEDNTLLPPILGKETLRFQPLQRHSRGCIAANSENHGTADLEMNP